MTKPRYKALTITRAMRESWAAVRHVKQQPGLVRVLMALHILMLSRQRLEDSLSHKQIAEEAGVSLSTVKRALRTLHDYGAIHYEPGYRRKREAGGQRRSRIRIAPQLSAEPFEIGESDPLKRVSKPTPHRTAATGKASEGQTSSVEFEDQSQEHAARFLAEAEALFLTREGVEV